MMTDTVLQTTSNRVQINPEFKSLIPPLADDERRQLEANLLADGCRDPLVVWNGVLLDGHNRYDICTKHGISFYVDCINLDSKEAAVNWIINNQLGRRNLHPDQASYLRGKRYNLEKSSTPNPHGVGGKSGKIVGGNSCPQQKTADKLAAEYKVSPRTIKNDGQYANAVDTLQSAGIEPQRVIAKETKSDVIEYARAIQPPPEPEPAPLLPPEPPKPQPPLDPITEKVARGEITIAQANREVMAAKRQEKKETRLEQGWTDDQIERKELVKQGVTVVASQRTNSDGIEKDAALLAWADQQRLLVRIDRQTEWGNPFELPADGDRDEVCEKFARYYMPHKTGLQKKLHRLKGKVLVCWCHPERCHGDHLAELANNGH